MSKPLGRGTWSNRTSIQPVWLCIVVDDVSAVKRTRTAWLAATLAGLLCVVVVGAHVATMSPLAAVPSPFRWLVTTHPTPEYLRLAADVGAVDLSRLADTLRQISVEDHLLSEGNETDPGDPRFSEISLRDAQDNQLSLLKTAGRYYARVLQGGNGPNGAVHLALIARKALLKLGFKDVVT